MTANDAEELRRLQEQFALLVGFIDGLTHGVHGDIVRKDGIADLRGLLHGMDAYKKMLGNKLKVPAK